MVGRQKNEVFSAAQYYRSLDSGQMDAIGLQISTSGYRIDEVIQKLKEEGDSESVLYLQGLSDRIAEDMADYLHNLLRDRIGIQKNSGTRYSPGYPAITNLENNLKISRQLNASQIGILLTSAYEFSPTGSTAAVVCFHPDASYI